MKSLSWRTTRWSAGMLTALAVFLAGPAAGHAAAAAGWTWPVQGRVITSYLNDNAKPYAGGMHRGIDIAAPLGTSVVAAHAGSVTYAASLGSSGLTVAIRTSDARHMTSYLHLSKITVRKGAAVVPGEKVGEVGATGKRSADEPHLHFGVRLADTEHSYIDPLTLLPALEAKTPESPIPVAAPEPVRAQAAPVPVDKPVPMPALAPTGVVDPFPAGRSGPAQSIPVVGRPIAPVRPTPLRRPIPVVQRPVPATRPIPVRQPIAVGPGPIPATRRTRAGRSIPVVPQPIPLGRQIQVGRRVRGGPSIPTRQPILHDRPKRQRTRPSASPPRSVRRSEGADWGRLIALLGAVLVILALASTRASYSLAKLRLRARVRSQRSDERPAPGHSNAPAFKPLSEMG